MKIPNQLDATTKTVLVIRSCKTRGQLLVANNMIRAHFALYRDWKQTMWLDKIIGERLERITKLYLLEANK